MTMSLTRVLLLCLLTTLAGCGGGGGNDRPSSNADLSSLALDAAALEPLFSAGTTRYTADVTGGTTGTRVTARSVSTRATIRISGVIVPSGIPSAPIDLMVGETDIVIEVTAQAGNVREYRLLVTRPAPGTNATLASLALSAGPLDQPFDPNLTDYTSSVGTLATSARVLATPTDPLADGLTLNAVPIAFDRPSPFAALVEGTNPLELVATAEDDVSTASYRIAVHRASASTLAARVYVKAPNTEPDRFGTAIALAPDLLLAGAPLEASSARGTDGDQQDNSASAAGAAYVYDRIGASWLPGAYLKAANADPGDGFGSATAAADGLLLVGAPGEQSLGADPNDNSGPAVGAAYLFDRSAGGWVQIAYLKARNPGSNDAFGAALSLYDDLALVGAPGEAGSGSSTEADPDDASPRAGAAYLFAPVGAEWLQIAYLKAAEPTTNDAFGSDVAIWEASLAVGAPFEDSAATGVDGDATDNSRVDSGAAYVFRQSGDGGWLPDAYVKASNTDPGDRFGTALALDGQLLAVGAPGEDGSGADPADNSLVDAGAVYVYAAGPDGWALEAYIKAPSPGFGDRFGSSVALQGNLLAVGAPGERSGAVGIDGNAADESSPGAGAVYLFLRDDQQTWQPFAYVKAPNTDAGDAFGAALALHADILGVAAPAEQSASSGVDGDQTDNSLSDAGAAYLYR